jgi:hypothetical protein
VKIEKFGDSISTVDVNIVELNDKMKSEISNLGAQNSAGSLTSIRAATVAEAGQADKARLADYVQPLPPHTHWCRTT